MRSVIVGTAGHIDHGKTALVRALTGIDTDRLEEEKRRGISIELGFAYLQLDADTQLGFVDVPGHERFVKAMLAGVGGIDIVLLVIAADESLMPQTCEHFDICRLLGVRRGIIVLTKADLVDKDILDLVRLEAEEAVRGSFLEGAPVVTVSSTTGQGLDELRAALGRVVMEITPRDSAQHFRLPVDRSFSMRGFGTVVTGTLISGAISREREVAAHPQGLRLRIRGIQVHGRAVERAEAGQRTALNLTGAEPADLPRGTVLTEPGLFRPVQHLDCTLSLLASAKPLKHRAPVHFHAGTAEALAEVRLLDGSAALKPGGLCFARILLREPVLILPGDRFIVRKFSPVTTIGGGTVVDIEPPRIVSAEEVTRRLRVLAGGSLQARVELLVGEAPHGLGIGELVARTGLRGTDLQAAAESPGILLLREPQTWLLDRDRSRVYTEHLRANLTTFHRENPLQPGMSREELRSRELPAAPEFVFDALIEQAGDIVREGELLRMASHRLALQLEEEQALAAIESAFAEAGLEVPSLDEALSRAGVDSRRARALLQLLLREQKLIKVGEEFVFHRSVIDKLKLVVGAHKGERFSVPQFKDWTGLSRKYAIPLLEYMDRQKLTRRDGDQRVVL